jgi:hypothetical protein
MKKRFIGFMLATAMMVAVAGCGKQITPAENVTEETAVEETAQAEEQTAEAEQTESAEAEENETAEAEAPAEEESDVEFTTGTVNGNVYENEYFGIKLTVPSDYSFLDDDTLSQLTGMASDIMKDNKAAKQALENGTAAIVAYGIKSGAADNINVTIQSNASLANTIFDEKAIMDVSKDQLKSALESQGAEITSCEVVESEVAGEKHYIIELTGNVNGMEVHEQVVNFQKGDYMMAIEASTFNSDDAATLMSGVEKN